MKIIRPIDLTVAGVVESNAPMDGYAQWEPVGRDNGFQGSASGAVSANGKLYASQVGGVVGVYDIVNGGELGRFAAGENIIAGLAHNGANLLAIPRESTLDVVDTSTWQIVHQIADDYSHKTAYWSRDGSTLAIFSDHGANGRCLQFLDSADWSVIGYSETLEAMSPLPDALTPVSPNDVFFNSAGDCFLVATTYVYTPQYEKATYLAKISQAGQTIHVKETATDPTGGIINDARGEVILRTFLSPYFEVFSESTLAEVSIPQSMNFPARAIRAGGNEIYANPSSQSPYHRRFSAADYTELSSLAMPQTSQYDYLAYAGDFFVGIRRNASEYDIVELATNTLITQTNPTVTGGDIYTYNNHNYEALQDNNDRPDLGAIKVDPETLKPAATWLDLGFINPLRMFDNKLDSKTTAPSPLVIDINHGMLVNGLALFNVDAATVQITYTDPDDGLVYDTGQISMLDNSGVQDWYSFFFDPYLVKADLARVDLPAYIDGSVQITLDGAGADVAIGEVVLGTIYHIGDAQYGSSAGIIDFSRKETDQFGNFEIVPRRFSKRAEFDTVIPPAYGGSVQRTLARLRATPVVWIGSVDLEETIVYGYFREFDILLSNPAFSNVTITVEGL